MVKLRKHWQVVGDEQRAWPAFIVIGAQRSGTTSLYAFLSDHPAVSPAKKKEVHFFDINYSKGLDWYNTQFPLQSDMKSGADGHSLITGEASPYYIYHPLAPERIAENFPDAKLIMMLRNPIERAYSHFQFEIKLGNETLSFEKAIQEEPNRLDGEVERILADEKYRSFNHQHFSYLSRGLYCDQLTTWFKLFDRQQFFFINSEEFFSNPDSVVPSLLEFLELPNWSPPPFPRKNQGKYSAIQPDTRLRLMEYYRSHNENLCQLLNRRFDWDE